MAVISALVWKPLVSSDHYYSQSRTCFLNGRQAATIEQGQICGRYTTIAFGDVRVHVIQYADNSWYSADNFPFRFENIWKRWNRGVCVLDWNRPSRSAIATKLKMKKKKKLCGLSPRATAACWRSYCQLLRIEGTTWSAWRIPTAVFSAFQTGTIKPN
jgi:hypothetical protein